MVPQGEALLLPHRGRCRSLCALVLAAVAEASWLPWERPTTAGDSESAPRGQAVAERGLLDDLEQGVPSCDGKEAQWAMCTEKPCGDCIPKHCAFSDWSDWSPLGGCTGLGKRHRTMTRINNECGRPCRGPMEETRMLEDFTPDSCTDKDQDCEWEPWSDWSHCGDCKACQKDRLAQSTRGRNIAQKATGVGAPCSGSFNQSIPCGIENPIDCEWTEWSDWTQCSKSCDGGWQSHIRRFKKEARFGGLPCTGDLRETVECSTQPCGGLQDCELSSWSDWEGCTGFHVGRNRHQMFRERIITKPAANGGKPCHEVAVKEVIGCPEGSRIDLCTYAPWSSWSDCPVTCDGGQQERNRAFNGDPRCKELEADASLREVRGCNRRTCKDSCPLTKWTSWSECSATCDTGLQERSRKLRGPAGSRSCVAALKEVKACLQRSCGVQDCAWEHWEAWSDCTSPCGGGLKRRIRGIAQLPSKEGAACSAKDKLEVAPCNMGTCEDCTDGKWSSWSLWSDCTATCMPAYRHRSRRVLQKANHCGRQATGPEDEYDLCTDLQHCVPQQDCLLSPWSKWTECSSECFGVTERNREVVQTASNYGRKCQERGLKEVEACNPSIYQDMPVHCLFMGPEPCRFGHWDQWSECSATCDGGQKSRHRAITSKGMHGGLSCQGSLSQTAPCASDSCDPERHCINCEWGSWSEWGHCSGCGGQRYRQRSVVQEPNWCGNPCDKATAKETMMCDTKQCGEAYCVWKDWGEAGPCSATCGSATQMRKRNLHMKLELEKDEDYFIAGTKEMSCKGQQTSLEACRWKACDGSCVAEDCKLADWGDWGKPSCDQLCTRHRLITKMNSCNGKPCEGSLLQTKPCKKDCGGAMNCVLSPWTKWSECFQRQTFRMREIEEMPKNGGQTCPETVKETKPCNTDYSPRNCEFADWGDWSSCTKLCGGGTHQRVRRIRQLAKNGGDPCGGDIQQLASCHTGVCSKNRVKDCLLGDWTEWQACDSDNQQKRRRYIDVQPLYGGKPCDGAVNEVRPCHTAIDCIISPWAHWDECDKSCDGGQQQRNRQVVTNPRNGGKPCPEDLVTIRGCNLEPCPSNVNCEVTSWAQWGECSASCGVGYQERQRNFKHKLSHCGEGCQGNLTQVRPCADKLPECGFCKTCKWGEWEQWTSCSKHCGGGQHHRVRNITRYPDAGCGACEARSKTYTEPCNVAPCSDGELCVDGQWNDWQDWATCTTSCEGGSTFRMRSVRLENTACGKPAEGLAREEGSCMEDIPCTPDEDCEFAEWGPWTDCSASCAGIKKRSRTVAVHGRGKNGRFCEGALNETHPCAFGSQASLLDWRKSDLYMVVDKVPVNNLGNNGPDRKVEPTLRYSRVLKDPNGGVWLDLLIVPDDSNGRHYHPADARLNGKLGVFGSINVQSHTMADFHFVIVKEGTNEPVVVEDFLLKFFDLDEGSDHTAHTVVVRSSCEEYYRSRGSMYIAEGDCAPGGNESVAFRKPILVDPTCQEGTIFDLDLSQVVVSNLAGKGPDAHMKPELRYEKAAIVDNNVLDLVIELMPGSYYEPARAIDNGYNGRFGIINLAPGSHVTTFRARFVNTKTKELYPVPMLNLTFFDLDQPSPVVREMVEMRGSDFHQWYYPNGMKKTLGNLAYHRTDEDFYGFTSKLINVTDPANSDIASLTPEQSKVAVTFFLESKAEFHFGLHVTQNGPQPGIRKDRDFHFAGKYCAQPAGSRRLAGEDRGLPQRAWRDAASAFEDEAAHSAEAVPRALADATTAAPSEDGLSLGWGIHLPNPRLSVPSFGFGSGKEGEAPPNTGVMPELGPEAAKQQQQQQLAQQQLAQQQELAQQQRDAQQQMAAQQQMEEQQRLEAQKHLEAQQEAMMHPEQQAQGTVHDSVQGPVVGTVQSKCHGKARHPYHVEETGPASLTAAQEKRAIAIRFRSVDKIALSLGVHKGACGHNFLFAAKVCVSGGCDDCIAVNGCHFSVWQEWGSCDVQCGGGSRNRSRDVIRVGGTAQVAQCSGPIQYIKSCNTHPCGQGCAPVNCKWGDWHSWSPCLQCGTQVHRKRHVVQHADCGGLPCDPGSSEETKECTTHCEEKLYCTWNGWTPWSACSVTCGCGRKLRTRTTRLVGQKPTDFEQMFNVRELNSLKDRVHRIERARWQVMLSAFAAGCLTFVAGLTVHRSCRRSQSRRPVHTSAHGLSREVIGEAL